MIHKVIMFIIGVILCSYSVFFIIVYLNLLKMGYTFIDYLKLIVCSFECNIIILGIILICLSLRRKKYELYK